MAIHTSPETIRMPHGANASFSEMQSYGSVLQAFITDQEAKLDDVEDPKHHSEIIDYLQSLANGYNEQLRIYKAKQKNRQRELMSDLMRVLEN